MKRKIGAWIILILLLVVPFFNWKLGALFWMCACLIFICQGLFKGKPIEIIEDENEETDQLEK